MPRKYRPTTDRRSGGWNFDSVCKALVYGGFMLVRAAYSWSEYRCVEPVRDSVVVPMANKPNDHWSPRMWNDWLKRYSLRVISDVNGREMIVPDGD